jgi:hypothetical protein
MVLVRDDGCFFEHFKLASILKNSYVSVSVLSSYMNGHCLNVMNRQCVANMAAPYLFKTITFLPLLVMCLQH